MLNMKRNSELKPDKRDLELLYLLDVNGRASHSELAKKLKISKQLVKYRIERLESEGFIKGYFAMIDTSRLGYTTFRVYLKFRNLSGDRKEKVISYLKSLNSVWAVILIAGKWDVALGISVKDIYDFYNIWDDLLKNELEIIGDYSISVYSPIYHYSKAYLVDKKDVSPVRILGGKGLIQHDDTDIKILKEISINARAHLIDLSIKLNMTPEAINYRIKNLEKKGIIQGYRAMIDVNKLGYQFYKAEIRLSKYRDIDKMISFFQSHPNAYQVDRTIGGETIEVEFHVKNLKEMINILDDFSKLFPASVERFDYITVISEEKTTYMP